MAAGSGPGRCREVYPETGRQCIRESGHMVVPHQASTGFTWPTDDTPPLTVDLVNHPPHYTGHPSGLECIWVTRHMPFDLGNAVKYVWRAPDKGNEIQDLEKSIWYLQDQIHEFGQIIGLTASVQAKLLAVATAEEAAGHTMRATYFRTIAAGDLRGALTVVQDMVHALQTGETPS